ncbi:MAG: DDE-type integrase/transposase/recombinase [Pseudonocardiaceae bacterium]
MADGRSGVRGTWCQRVISVARWVYLYRAIDQYGQVIDVPVSLYEDLAVTLQFFIRDPRYG